MRGWRSTENGPTFQEFNKQYEADTADHPPLAAPNVLPNAPPSFFLWHICTFPHKFHLDG